jgi:hypothetical protein
LVAEVLMLMMVLVLVVAHLKDGRYHLGAESADEEDVGKDSMSQPWSE